MNDSPISGHARLHAVVTGRVQGVSFRYFVSEQAGAFGLLGWVRNRHDGSVEVTGEGPRPRLEGLLAALWQGPPSARVDDVQSEWQVATGEFGSFWVRATG